VWQLTPGGGKKKNPYIPASAPAERAPKRKNAYTPGSALDFDNPLSKPTSKRLKWSESSAKASTRSRGPPSIPNEAESVVVPVSIASGSNENAAMSPLRPVSRKPPVAMTPTEARRIMVNKERKREKYTERFAQIVRQVDKPKVSLNSSHSQSEKVWMSCMLFCSDSKRFSRLPNQFVVSRSADPAAAISRRTGVTAGTVSSCATPVVFVIARRFFVVLTVATSPSMYTLCPSASVCSSLMACASPAGQKSRKKTDHVLTAKAESKSLSRPEHTVNQV